MKLVGEKPHINNDAADVLESVLERVKSGEIQAVAVSWVEGNAIDGDCSSGDNNIMLWAAIEHTARSFYEDVITK